MDHPRLAVALLAALAVPGCLAPGEDGHAPSPYAGREGAPVVGLDAAQVEALRRGDGLGYALAAELNGYPGPKHALDLADALGLSRAQRDEVAAVRARMLERAVPAGEALVAAHAALEAAFREGGIDEARLLERTAAVGAAEAELRAAHLWAHVETAALLTPGQREAYDRLRGYSGHSHEGHGSGGH